MAATTHKVVKGDTLSEIAVKYYKSYNYSSWKTYMNYLADLNNIKNVDLIYIGQVIKLTGSKSTASTNSSTKVTVEHFGLQSNTDNVIFVTWTFNSTNKTNTENYQVEWSYYTDNKVWFIGSDSTATAMQSTYSMPSNATKVRVRIKPVSKTYTKNNKTTSYFTGAWSSYSTFNASDLPLTPPAKPTLKFTSEYVSTLSKSKYFFLAETTFTIDEETNRLTFQYVNIDTGGTASEQIIVPMNSVIYDKNEALNRYYNFTDGASYKVRCRAEVYKNNKVQKYSEWSEFSEVANTVAATSAGFVECYAESNEAENKADVFLKWARVGGATSYEIEYTNDIKYFDSSAGTSVQKIENPEYDENKHTSCRIVSLDVGKEYFFRLRSINDAGESPWSAISSVILGTKPTMPTTWSLTNTAMVGEKMILYWQHNSEDGSKQTSAELTLTQYITTFKRYKAEIGGTLEYYVLTSEKVYFAKVIDELVRTIYDAKDISGNGIDIVECVDSEGNTYYAGGPSERPENEALNKYYNFAERRTLDYYTITSEEISQDTTMEGSTLVVGAVDQDYKLIDVFSYTDDNGDTAYFYVSDESTTESIEDVKNISGDMSFYELNTNTYGDGATIGWKVRTSGVLKENGEYVYSDPSTERTFNIYSQPRIELNMTNQNGDSIDLVESFPFHIYAYSGPLNQKPIMYQVSITANDTYEAADNVGNIRTIYAGEQVYSKHFNPSEINPYELLLELSAGDVALENNIDYTLTCTVAMNSGLTGTGAYDFSVEWTEKRYEPNAEIGVDDIAYTASIRPYCEYFPYYKVLYDPVNETYTNTKEEIPMIEEATVVSNAYTDTGEEVNEYSVEGIKAYFCISNESQIVDDVILSVYRRDFDGNFVEIASGIDNNGGVIVTDPHPALDYARYRIVATQQDTGMVSYCDIPEYPIGGTAIIIQWDESWTEFTADSNDELVESPWTGSMLKLPYNISVSDSYSKDSSLINYIGRKHPVAYYGTQVGQTSSWSTVIPAYDTETLNGLRRLAIYQGNAYVREPSGSGYWADVKVSFNQSYNDLTIPVSLSITRVEGGV